MFSSDGFSRQHVVDAKAVGCLSHGVQLGTVGDAFAAQTVRDLGLRVVGWGACGPVTLTNLVNVRPDVWMPQVESTAEFNALVFTLAEAREDDFLLPPCEPVMTSGGMEPGGSPTDAEKTAERARRRDLLRSFGVTVAWPEVYKQDADRSGQANLGDVNGQCAFWKSAYGFVEAWPAIGLWTADDHGAGWARNPYRVSDYDLSRVGRTFGAWRAEQMSSTRYPEIAAVPASSAPPPAPTGPTVSETRQAMQAAAVKWETSLSKPQPRSRITIGKRIVRLRGISDASWREHAATFEALCDQAEADE